MENPNRRINLQDITGPLRILTLSAHNLIPGQEGEVEIFINSVITKHP